jgi:hypothetical protein
MEKNIIRIGFSWAVELTMDPTNPKSGMPIHGKYNAHHTAYRVEENIVRCGKV